MSEEIREHIEAHVEQHHEELNKRIAELKETILKHEEVLTRTLKLIDAINKSVVYKEG